MIGYKYNIKYDYKKSNKKYNYGSLQFDKICCRILRSRKESQSPKLRYPVEHFPLRLPTVS